MIARRQQREGDDDGEAEEKSAKAKQAEQALRRDELLEILGAGAAGDAPRARAKVKHFKGATTEAGLGRVVGAAPMAQPSDTNTRHTSPPRSTHPPTPYTYTHTNMYM